MPRRLVPKTVFAHLRGLATSRRIPAPHRTAERPEREDVSDLESDAGGRCPEVQLAVTCFLLSTTCLSACSTHV